MLRRRPKGAFIMSSRNLDPKLTPPPRVTIKCIYPFNFKLSQITNRTSRSFVFRSFRYSDPHCKYEHILLLARHILVLRICIFKYNVFWLGLFGVLLKKAYLGVITTKYNFNTYFHLRNCIHMPNTVYLQIRMYKYF